MTLSVSRGIEIPLEEIELSAVRAGGPGGQHVNKVSSAIHLRFDIGASSLPEALKERLYSLPDGRISEDGIVTIKARRFRSRDQNRRDALERLAALVRGASNPPRERRPTRPTRASKQRRLDAKNRRSRVKALRGRVDT